MLNKAAARDAALAITNPLWGCEITRLRRGTRVRSVARLRVPLAKSRAELVRDMRSSGRGSWRVSVTEQHTFHAGSSTAKATQNWLGRPE